MKMEQLKSRIEAVLFVTAKVLQIKDIAEILEEEPEKVEEALLELIMDYASREGIAVILGEEKEIIEDAILELIMDYSARGGALEIDDENGYILQVKEDYMDLVELLCPVDLKPAALRTLSVIALKEPLRQTALIELRGSSAYDHIKELVDKGLVAKHATKTAEALILKQHQNLQNILN